MGTNYYQVTVLCEHCGNSERLHVGKSSGGWCFSLHVYPEMGINDLNDWIKRAQHEGFEDEYGRAIAWVDLRPIIERRGDGFPMDPEWARRNNALVGPNGLARHRLEEGHCIGHGAGTYDLIVGEFS